MYVLHKCSHFNRFPNGSRCTFCITVGDSVILFHVFSGSCLGAASRRHSDKASEEINRWLYTATG
jgi:hypothetical protein